MVYEDLCLVLFLLPTGLHPEVKGRVSPPEMRVFLGRLLTVLACVTANVFAFETLKSGGCCDSATNDAPEYTILVNTLEECGIIADFRKSACNFQAGANGMPIGTPGTSDVPGLSGYTCNCASTPDCWAPPSLSGWQCARSVDVTGEKVFVTTFATGSDMIGSTRYTNRGGVSLVGGLVEPALPPVPC